MGTANVALLSMDGINRSTIIVVIVAIVILVILLIVRAMMVRRKANDASSTSAESDYRPRRLQKKRNFQVKAANQEKPLVVQAAKPDPGLGVVVNAPLVHFQQGPVVQTQKIIDTKPALETCSGGDCGAQLEATPQLVQTQKNIHQPSKEIPVYRQPVVRNPRAAMQARMAAQRAQAQIVQQAQAVEEDQEEEQEEIEVEEEVEEEIEEEKPEPQPRSNYRLVRGPIQ